MAKGNGNNKGKKNGSEDKCFYCKERVLNLNQKWSAVKGYCESSNCIRDHEENRRQGGFRWIRYKKHEQTIRQRIHQPRIKALKCFYILKNNSHRELFREEGIWLGRIINENEDFVFVQKSPFGEVVGYNKICIA